MVLARARAARTCRASSPRGDLARTPYLVMERVEGRSLKEWAERAPLPPRRWRGSAPRVATAIHALHLQDAIHLDLKPSNVIVRPDGEAVLIDFGLAHHAHYPDLLAEEFRRPIGTAPYISPEQVLGVALRPAQRRVRARGRAVRARHRAASRSARRRRGRAPQAALARPGPAARPRRRTSPVAAGDRPALPRARRRERYATAAQVALRLSRARRGWWSPSEGAASARAGCAARCAAGCGRRARAGAGPRRAPDRRAPRSSSSPSRPRRRRDAGSRRCARGSGASWPRAGDVRLACVTVIPPSPR